MDCTQAKNLFDAYLDGELSSSLETELAAHRLLCGDCRHALALMEVAGHVIASDTSGNNELSADFTQRLLACVESQPGGSPWAWMGRRRIAAGGLAMAAMLTVVLFIWSSKPSRHVAGVIVKNPAMSQTVASDASTDPASHPDLGMAANSLVQQVESTWSVRLDSAHSLLDFGQLTILQILEQFGTDDSSGGKSGEFESLPDSFDELAPANAADDLEEL